MVPAKNGALIQAMCGLGKAQLRLGHICTLAFAKTKARSLICDAQQKSPSCKIMNTSYKPGPTGANQEMCNLVLIKPGGQNRHTWEAVQKINAAGREQAAATIVCTLGMPA